MLQILYNVQSKKQKKYINYSLHNWHLGDKNYVVANGSAGKESACNAGDKEDASWIPGLRRIPWRRKWQPTPVFLPGESRVQRSLAIQSMGSQS